MACSAAAESEFEGQIAVIGMAGRWPGASDLETFWTNLREGVEALRLLDEDELLAAGESPALINDPSYVRAAAPLDGFDQFDAGFFGMSPRDAAVFDPQHRLFLECAWEAFEHAGYVGSQIDGAVGVFASCGLSEYMFKNVLANAEVASAVGEWLVRHTGNDTNFLATRVSYELDLTGPSMNVQTACSSSLVAIHLACQSLLNGECDVALAGGVVVLPGQHKGYLYREGEILSPDGHCRAFDEKAAGTILSSASACVLLKPLAAAIEDGDNVLAVVLGSAINNDGRAKVGYLAPSVDGQSAVISEALGVADLDAREVTYVEAHGTGTLIGDPIEIAALTKAYRHDTDDVQFCAIGSLKTNIGHAGEASGAAAFIKTVLALQHRMIPPSLHYQSPNPQAEMPETPFFVNGELRRWMPGPGGRRIAGITNLGAGGTNAHLLLGEAPARLPAPAPPRADQLVVVTARSDDALSQAIADLAEHLRANPDVDMADVAFTRLAGRKQFAARAAIVARTAEDAARALEQGGGQVLRQHHRGPEPSVAFLVPGGGAQYAGMGRDLYDQEPVYRGVIDDCAELLRRRWGIDLLDVMFGDGPDRALERPSVALPALFSTALAMAALLDSWGIRPDAVIGHSAGEYVAACLAGVFSREDALSLVTKRGQLFETVDSGSMLSVARSEDDVRNWLPSGLDIAAVNAPEQCVVSGPTDEVERFEQQLRADDIDCARVHIDVAAHSSMLDPILEEFASFCRSLRYSEPTLPWVSNLTGEWITASQATDPMYWVEHLRRTVRFHAGVECLLADANRVLVEIGPGRTLAGFAQAATNKATAITATLRHPKELVPDGVFALRAVGRIWAAGVDLDAQALLGPGRRRIPLPTYPFEHHRYWIDPDPIDRRHSPRSGGLVKLADPADWFAVPTWRRSVAPAALDEGRRCWLLIGEGSGVADEIAVRLRARGDEVRTVRYGSRFKRSSMTGFTLVPGDRVHWQQLLDRLRADGMLPTDIVHLGGLAGPSWRRGGDLAAYDAAYDQELAGLLSLVQAWSSLSDPVRLAVVTSGVHRVSGSERVHAERALLHGATRVVPHELPNISTTTIDVELSRQLRRGRAHREELSRVLLGELDAATTDDVVYRDGRRWVRDFDPVALPRARATTWEDDAVVIISGGLGGIGLTLASHICATVRAPVLVLLGRTSLPPESQWPALLVSRAADPTTMQRIEAITQLREGGATVHHLAVDVTDERALRDALAPVVGRYRGVHTVVHAAGVLDDALIALRDPAKAAPVVHAKARGALALAVALADRPPTRWLLFSSVSSILGLPGQADYSAANAFLDAFAAQLSADGQVAIAVDWNAWQEVGMAAVSVEPMPPPPRLRRADVALRDGLLDEVVDAGDVITGTTVLSRAGSWLVGEHAVRGGDAVVPGTGYAELIGEVAAAGRGAPAPVEIRDLTFSAPFVVRPEEERALHVRLERATGLVAAFAENEQEPNATAEIAGSVTPRPDPLDLGRLQARCAVSEQSFDGFMDQPFMDFGPRWDVLRTMHFGVGEALVHTSMPAAYRPELATLWLHPGLLDMATGMAHDLIPRSGDHRAFYVPLSYGRITSYAPLPPEAISYIRLHPGSSVEVAIYDVTICAPDGTVVVDIADYTMRRAEPAFAGAATPSANPERAVAYGLETPLTDALRVGMLPAEGIDALERLLAQDLGPQVVASSADLQAWRDMIEVQARVIEPDAGAPAAYGRPALSAAFEEPATPIENELARSWRELLGVERVGRNDDFFELGGQSMIAMRLFAWIRRHYQVDMPLATLFEAPTIAQCARVIAAQLGVEDVAESEASTTAPIAADIVGTAAGPAIMPEPPASRSLIPIASAGKGRPFFIVHGAGGNILFLWGLARALAGDRPIYGFQAMGVNAADQPDDSVEAMAARYVAELTAAHDGPYLLGAFSGGGVVALEMVRQLQALGHEVAHVILFDSVPTDREAWPTWQTRLLHLADSARRDGVGSISVKAISPRRAPQIARALSRISPRFEVDAAEWEQDKEAALGFEVGAGYVDLYEHNSEIFSRYRPSEYDVDVTVFKAHAVAAMHRWDYYWSDHVRGSLTFEIVDGDHHTMFYPDYIPDLAAKVRRRLADVAAH